MKDTILSTIQKIRLTINQILRKIYVYRKIIFNILLAITCGLIIVFISMTMDLATSKTAKTEKIATTSKSTYVTSWLGNSIGKGKLRIQNNIEAMYVKDDGTIYTNSVWDEAGSEAGIYKDGQPIFTLEDTHGWNRVGGKAVIANNQYIYLAMSQGGMNHPKHDYPPEGEIWHSVRRYDLQGKPAPFDRGRGWDKSMLIVSKTSEITGLTIVDNKLFVSSGDENFIHVYNLDTMEEINKFPVTNPGSITVDKQENLWIIQNKKGTKSATIVNYSQTGKNLGKQITDVVNPAAISIDNQGRLLVGENGELQQVLIYNINNQPTKVGSFGDKNGIFSGVPGEIKPSKLYGITGVGTDSKGNLYINNNGFNKSGVDLRKFSQLGKLEWQLLGLIFVDNADTDPQTDGLNIFTKQEEYTMDYNKSAGEEWSYKAYTINPFKYSQDPRLHTSPDGTFFRRIQGKPFLFLTDMYNSKLQIYRFNAKTDGKIAIPSGLFVGTSDRGEKSISGNWPPYQPLKGEWIWRDINGNGSFEKNEYDQTEDYPYIGGWWVDNKGDVWKTLRTENGIRHYPLQGIDKQGNLIYSYKSMKKEKTPSIVKDLRRIEYFPDQDVMYLSGFTVDHPALYDDAKVVGSEIIRFDNWSKGNRTPKWRIVVPYDTTGKKKIATAAMSVAGDYLFAVTFKTAEVYVYKTSTGEFVKKMNPGEEVGKESGWVDIPYGIRAFRRSNGKYLVFVEENWKGKVLVYQF